LLGDVSSEVSGGRFGGGVTCDLRPTMRKVAKGATPRRAILRVVVVLVLSSLARRRRRSQCGLAVTTSKEDGSKEKSFTRCLCHRLEAEVKQFRSEGGWKLRVMKM
jgi:hypothetical protein